MALPTYGGGLQGLAPVRLQCDPDSTLKTALDSAKSAGTEINGMLVKFSTGANREVTTMSDGDNLQGEIAEWRETATSYALSVDFYGYLDQGGNWNPAGRVATFTYNGSVALGNSVLVKSSTEVKADATGNGRIVNINASETTVDVIM